MGLLSMERGRIQQKKIVGFCLLRHLVRKVVVYTTCLQSVWEKSISIRTYAFFAVGGQAESRGAEALVRSLSVDTKSLASAVVNRALVHIF